MKKYLLLLLALPSLLPGRAQDTTAQKPSRVGITGIPSVSFDRSRGAGFGGMGMAFFPIGKDPAAPPSRVMVHAQVSTNKSWMAMAFGQLFLSKDRIRLVTGGGYLDSRFQTYVDVPGGGQIEVPFDSRGPFLFASPLFRTWKGLYIGPTAQFARMQVTFTPEGAPSVKQTNYANALGAAILYDTKDNQYNPSKGFTANLHFNSSPEWLGNDSVFNKLMLFANNYHRIRCNMILASRVSANVGLGDVPFTSQSYVGNKDIRGYTKGEYRGNQTYAAQTELRWHLYKRWGCVGFFGVAVTVDPTSQLLPGGGAGVRYLILKKYNINAGVDGAVGKNDWGIYFRITEAF